MPGPDGKLSPAEHMMCVNWINEKAASPNDACAVCGSPDNSVGLDIFQVRAGPAPRTAGQGVPYIPSVITSCNNCGFIRFFNALVLGLIPMPPLPEPELDLGGADQNAAAPTDAADG